MEKTKAGGKTEESEEVGRRQKSGYKDLPITKN